CRDVRFELPNCHHPEALDAVLRYSNQRLLSDERIRSNRTSVNLVRDQVAELHHVDVTDHHFLIESITGPAIKEPRLAGFLDPGETVLLFRVIQIFANLGFGDPVEDWGRDLEP